ncbi:hypothetical protein F2P81_008709 [Scophthalmus maximus]|uniref:Uncharacterized protein n=1 Tax=Scophthalmus maximus TaxID=52904 RepID=A0A6A4SZM1_SCOMX|nr:hypothetical protein F2P81_008709 [Scophthalmus maximus]
MVNIVEDFIDSPSVELLEQCNHEQLMKIDQHYHVEVEPKRTKENLRSIIQAHLQESGVLMNEGGYLIIRSSPDPAGVYASDRNKCVEEQKQTEEGNSGTARAQTRQSESTKCTGTVNSSE